MCEPRPKRAALGSAALAGALLMTLAAGPALGADERRDPLRPPDYQREQTTQPRFNADAWQLASTLVSGSRRVARINGQSVQPGDTVGGARVLAIHNGRVRLDYRGRQFTVRRSLPEIRRERGS